MGHLSCAPIPLHMSQHSCGVYYVFTCTVKGQRGQRVGLHQELKQRFLLLAHAPPVVAGARYTTTMFSYVDVSKSEQETALTTTLPVRRASLDPS